MMSFGVGQEGGDGRSDERISELITLVHLLSESQAC